MKKCTFALAGRIGGNVTAWTSSGATKKGRIVARGDTVTLSVPGAHDFPGCGMVLPPDIDAGLPYDKTSSAPWTSMRAVAVPRARLYTQAAGPAARGYVVRGDVVGVRGQQGGRFTVDYVSTTGRVISGWVAAAETAPLAPPR